MKKVICSTALTLTIFASAQAAAEGWTHGIGTGIGGLDVNGDAGFNTRLLGPVDFDASLKPDEVFDYVSSSLNLGGFSRKDDLTISYSFAMLDLEDDVSAVQGDNQGTIDVGFKTIVAEVTVGYTFARSGNHSFGAIGGVRHSDQEYDAQLVINGTERFDGSVDDNWTDAVIGLSHSYAISQTMSWNTVVDYGFGGSEGTTHIKTGISNVYGGHWLVGLALDYKDVEYEEDDRGGSDWFYYDAEETSLGLSVVYVF